MYLTINDEGAWGFTCKMLKGGLRVQWHYLHDLTQRLSHWSNSSQELDSIRKVMKLILPGLRDSLAGSSCLHFLLTVFGSVLGLSVSW